MQSIFLQFLFALFDAKKTDLDFFGSFDSVILTPVSYDHIYHISSTRLHIQSLFNDSQLDLSMSNL